MALGILCNHCKRISVLQFQNTDTAFVFNIMNDISTLLTLAELTFTYVSHQQYSSILSVLLSDVLSLSQQPKTQLVKSTKEKKQEGMASQIFMFPLCCC